MLNLPPIEVAYSTTNETELINGSNAVEGNAWECSINYVVSRINVGATVQQGPEEAKLRVWLLLIPTEENKSFSYELRVLSNGVHVHVTNSG